MLNVLITYNNAMEAVLGQ